MKTTIRGGLTLLALLAASAPSFAQDQQASRPAQERKPAQQQRPAADKPAAERPAAERQHAADASAGSREEKLKRLLQEESRHRERLAKIERLRQIAHDKNDGERLKQLGQMLKQENERFFGLIEKARMVLDDASFAALEQRLNIGRGRGKDFDPHARERAAQQPDARKGGDQARGERPKADAGAERPKADAGGERPKADGAQRGGNGDAQRSGNPR